MRAGDAPALKARPVRSAATIGAVLALLAGVAIPAYAATTNEGSDQPTAHQLAEANAQSLTVDEGAKSESLEVTSYAATTPEEIAEKKAAEEAAERAKRLAEMSSTASSGSSSTYTGSTEAPAPSGGVVFPAPAGSWSSGRGLGAAGYHRGWDIMAATGTPAFAAADGVITRASYMGTYGNVIFINSNVDGNAVETRYAHMSSMTVSPGQTVSAGDLIGYIGSTGNATAPHIHFEVRVNGVLTDPKSWLPY